MHHVALEDHYPKKELKKQKLTTFTDGDENLYGLNSGGYNLTDEAEFERQQENERLYGSM